MPVAARPRLQRRQMQLRHRRVGHDHRALLRQHRRQQRAGARQQIVADHHVIAGGRQHHRQPPRRLPRQQRVQHLRGGGVRALVAAIDDDVGLGIDRVTLVDQPLQDLGRVAVRQQRAMVAAGHPPHQRLQRTAQPDRDRIGARSGAGFRVHERAAAERQHQRVAREQAADHAAFAVAEGALAVAGEQLGDGAAGGQFDLGVGVAERQPESRGEAAADRGLAGAHQPDQHDAASGQGFRQRDAFLQRSVACHDGQG